MNSDQTNNTILSKYEDWESVSDNFDEILCEIRKQKQNDEDSSEFIQRQHDILNSKNDSK